MALAVVGLHLATARGYGIFRDELYYLACADHLAWGYVDHPPLSIAALAATRAVLGDSLLALRAVPAVLHALAVLGSALLATRLGAGAFGATLAALSVGVAPGFLGIASFYSMNAFDLVLWVAAALVFVEVLATGRREAWLLLGAVVGVGLMNKLSVVFLGVGLAAGLLASPRRRDLAGPWPWAAVGVAFLLFLPHVLWQIAHGWPTREFVANAQRYKISDLSVADFLVQASMEMLAPAALVGSVGLVALFVWAPLRPHRPLGVAFLVVLGLLIAQRSKPYYLDVAWPMLFAAGGVAWERIAATTRARTVLLGTLGLLGVAAVPLAVPVLPPERVATLVAVLGLQASSGEDHEMGPLPQHFADRFGWPEMAEAVAAVYHALPDEERDTAMIYGANYGEAGALRHYGRLHGLPEAVSQHNSFYLWGPGPGPHTVAVLIGLSREDLEPACEQIVTAGRFDHPYAMPYERDQTIWVCRGWKAPFDEIWRAGKLYI